MGENRETAEFQDVQTMDTFRRNTVGYPGFGLSYTNDAPIAVDNDISQARSPQERNFALTSDWKDGATREYQEAFKNEKMRQTYSFNPSSEQAGPASRKTIRPFSMPPNSMPPNSMPPHSRPSSSRTSGSRPSTTETDTLSLLPQALSSQRPSTRILSRIHPPRQYSSTHFSPGTEQSHPAQNYAELKDVDNLMKKMFGRVRQKQSEEEKTRHLGVIFKNLTVKGKALGLSIQPTVGDIFFDVPRALASLLRSRDADENAKIRTILNRFTGCIKPGEMLLVLGRPGAGVSTFLKAIGNQWEGFEKVEGRITYGGESASTIKAKYRSEVLYNPEADLQYATLKVKDTLKFALKTRTPGSHSRKHGESREDYINEFFQVATKAFWIEHTVDTIVGNEFKRGVSGGEKKRVSIAEALVSKASVQCWDDPTRGLDSKAALEYVRVLRSVANMAHTSTAVALYQASEAMWDCFDKVLLIDGGECCFFGPTDAAVSYFERLGFEKLDRWTSADFLTSVTSEFQRQVRPGFEDRIPRTPRQFSEIFRASEQRYRNQEDVLQFESRLYSMMEKRRDAQTSATETKNYALSFWKQVLVLTHRQFLVLKGDPQTFAGKWGGVLFEAVVVGLLFFDMPQTSDGIFLRGGVLFFMLLFNALLALAELTPAFEARPVLMKHKNFSFYRPAAYAIAQTLLDIPVLFIQVTIFNLIVYFMSGLQRTATRFLIANLFLYLLTLTVYAAFRAIGAIVSSLDGATRFTGIAMQALVVYTDYIIPPKKMKKWLAWVRWLNPIQYCFEALMVNEFDGLDIKCVPPNLIPPAPSAQTQFQSCTIQGSKPGSASVSGRDYLEVSFQFRKSHLWRNFAIIVAFFLFFVAVTALGMETLRSSSSSGSTAIFKRGQAPNLRRKSGRSDEEEDYSSEQEYFKEDDYEDEYTKGVAEKEDYAKQTLTSQSVFTWQNVDYVIPYKGENKQLLHNVQGYVKPGKLTALMGSSGAGKTTLLNALAQRLTFGVVTGDFRVNGSPLPSSFQRSAGFAEQMDIHEPTQTVREALRFSARLRQPYHVSLREKYQYCEEIIDLLEMRDIAGAVIGTPGAGLNQEQRKRLTIAVELASKPQLLMFLDEPTSGLDSIAAANLLRLLRKLADSGQAILCTIHQPSAVLFEYFDMLLLLKRGGHTVYFGELGVGSRILLNYLESHGAPKCPPKANPAEYMLEAIGAGKPDQEARDWAEIWRQSNAYVTLTREIQDMTRPKGSLNASVGEQVSGKYATPIIAQIKIVVHRSFSSIWRSRDYVMGIFILHIIVGLFSTFSFWMLGNSQLDMQSRLFAIFMTLIIAPPLIQQLQPRFLEARNIYTSREAKAKMYTWFAFVSGAILSEIPYRVVGGTLYWACWYFGIGFPRGNLIPFKIWTLIILFELFYLGLGLGIAAFSPSVALASFFIPLFFMFVISFCGIAVPFAALPGFLKWMYYVTPFTYLLEALLGLVIHKVPITCARDELAVLQPPPGLLCEDYLGPYVAQAGGYVQTLADGFCGYCQFKDGDQFGVGLHIFEKNFWRDFCIFGGCVMFNFGFVYVCSWVYMQDGLLGRLFSRGKKVSR